MKVAALIKVVALAAAATLACLRVTYAGAVEGADAAGLEIAYEQTCNSETGWMPDEARTLLRLKAYNEGFRSQDSTHSSLAYARADRYSNLWTLTGKREACLTVLVKLREAVSQPGMKELAQKFAPPKQGQDCDLNGTKYSCFSQRGSD